MKKVFFTLALALGLGFAATAQESGLFGYGPQRGGGENYSTDYNDRTGGLLNLPGSHGLEDDQSPLGTGTVLLLGLGAAYLATKKRKNQKNPKHHNSKFFLIAAALTAGMISAQPMNVIGQTYTQVTELDMTTKEYGTSNYNANTAYTSNSLEWHIVYGANNNKSWSYFKMGGKSATLANYNPCYIYSPQITEKVDKVTVHLPAGSLSKTGMSVNSWALCVYSSSTMTAQNRVDSIAGGTITNSEGTFNFTPSTNVTWAANYYYKVTWDLANTTTTNGIICVDKITLYKEASGPTQLTAPTLTATPNPGKVTLAWNSVSNASSYTIQYADNSSFTGATTITNATSPKEITGLTNGTTYYFKAMSVGDGTNYISSDYGEVVSATPTAVQLTAPTLTATPANGKVTLEWTAVSNASSYTIQYADNSSFTDATTVTNATSPKEITGLSNGTTYYFRAMSVGDGTNYTSSDYGSAISAAPSNLTKITITQDSLTNFTNEYKWYDWSAGGVSGKAYAYKNSGMQFNSGKDGYWIYNTTAIPGAISSVKMTKASGTDRTWTLKAGTSALTATDSGTAIGSSQTVGTTGTTWNVSGTYNYFLLYVSGGATVIGSIEITYIPSTDPIIVASDPEALAYNAAGGEFGYSITNPTSATLNAQSNSAWITNVVVDGTNSKVTFSTSTNPNTTQRTGTITLSYTGATDKVITITQNGAPAPTISADDVEIAYNATSGEITYTLNNPVANGSLSVSEEVAWISNATLNTTENKVTFTSETSEGVVARTGIVTITYTYNSQTVSKEVTVTQGVDATLGTAANPYTVAQARTFIDGLNGQPSADGKHVSGKISQVDSYNSTYNSITYWISDDGTTTNQLEVYSGKGINGADFSAVTDVAVGAEVVVKGKLKYYSNQSVYEFDYDNELVSYTAPVVTTPTITVNPATVNATAAGIYVGTLDITYSNLTISDYNDFAIQFYDKNDNELNGTAEPDWLVVLTASDIVGGETVYLVSYSVDANIGAARTAYFKVWALDGATPVYSNKVTVTQAAYVPTPTDDDYVRISSLDQLTDGSIVIIAARYDDNNTNKYYAMANSTSGKPTGTLFTSSTLATNGNETLPSDFTDDEDDFYWVVNVTKVNNNTYYTFTNANGDKIGYKSSTDFTTNGDNTEWTIARSTSGDAAMVAKYTGFTITNKNIDTRGFALNSVHNFGPYATSNNGGSSYNFYLDFFVQMPTYTLSINHYTSQTTGWNLIASPATTVVPTADNGFLENTYDLYYFDQSQENVWVNYKDNGAHSNTNPGFNLVAGKGYLYANSEDVTLYFSGTPYKGNGVIGLDYDGTAADDMKGLNLVGNPWSVSASVDKSFYIMNEYGSEIVSTNDNTVAQMQGIFVVATDENQTVTFTPASTSAQPNNPAVTMNLTQNRGGVIDRAIVRFNGNDNLPKFQLFENSTKLYIAQDGKDYAIVGSEAQGEMPVCFQAKADGQYTISVDAENVEMGYLHLIDNITGADVDLLANPSYTFNAKWDDYTSRFRLVFSANNSNNAEAESDNFAFISNGQIILNGVNNNATLQVIDMLGRIVSSEQINGNSANLAPTASGVYVLRLINGTETKTQKIVVK